MMGFLLSLIPAPYRLLAAGIAAAALLAAIAGWGEYRQHQGDTAGYNRGMAVAAKVQATLDKERREWADERAAAAESARLAAKAALAETMRRTQALQEAVNAAELVAQRERADRVVADAAAGRLRERIDALVTAARFAARNPGLAIGSPPTDDATGVLADVLGRCVARVQRLAAIADERGRAGQLCERAYDALTETDGK
jgi:hypothetical protein